jgi:hypothetical protein
MIEINIAKDYSDTPGGRFIKEGPFSGEDFRETLLLPKYILAIDNNETLIVNMDGCFGYPSSFIDEAFGGLAKIYGSSEVLKHIDIISNDEPGLVEKIKKSIKDRV